MGEMKLQRSSENRMLREIYDRFSFDGLFKLLLNIGFEHEEALEFIISNCELSALVFQERIDNLYYQKISKEYDVIFPDLIIRNKRFPILVLFNKSHINKNKKLRNWIKGSYDGTEKQTIYGQLQETLGVKIEPAPDEWDRAYNVDFYIKVGDKYIGLQIKPTTFEHAPEYERKWKDAYKSSHEKFKADFGGKVFIILSVEEEKKKKIFNADLIVEEIRREIERLKRRLMGNRDLNKKENKNEKNAKTK